MQGHKGSIRPFCETCEFGHASSSTDTVHWNDTLEPMNFLPLPDYILPPHDMPNTCMLSFNNEEEGFSRWCHGESSSSNTEVKNENEMNSSLNKHTVNNSTIEERELEPTDILCLQNVSINLSHNETLNANDAAQPNSGSDSMPYYLNLYVKSSVTDPSHSPLHKLAEAEVERNQPYEAYALGSSFHGRRLSCKRKSVESISGQSSSSGPSPSALPPIISPTTINISGSSENLSFENCYGDQLNPRLGIGRIEVPSTPHLTPTLTGQLESLQRNFRMRINPTNRGESPPPPFMSPILPPRQWSPHPLIPRYLSVNETLNSLPVLANSDPQTQAPLSAPSDVTQSRNSTIWTTPSISRGNSPPHSVNSLNRNRPISISDHPRVNDHPRVFHPNQTRLLPPDPTWWNLINENSRPTISRRTRSTPDSTRFPHSPSPTEHLRRIPEHIHPALLSPPNSRSLNTDLPLHSGISSSIDGTFPYGSDNHDHQQPYLSSAFRSDGHNEYRAPGISFALRSLATAGERRNRLVSEIRNALDLMRRSENLRFEDVFILDHPMLLGSGDFHDRHRDMRLDVDNMSYEELLELEERIGDVCTGLDEETVLKLLKRSKFMSSISRTFNSEPCCICQEEYVDGNELGTLDCGHNFHKECIQQWLKHKNLCPICKTTGLVT